MSPPLISIVTPCLNRANYIAEAVESVLIQDFPSYEHIVTDGGSSDGTLDILRTYPHLRVVSEPDQGMYDAINKGIRMARGEIVGLLNTDDLYAEGCFEAVAGAFEQNPDAAAVVGGVTIFRDEAGGRRTLTVTPAIKPDELWFRLIQGSPVTNGWFFRRSVFERVGYFDLRYHISSDRQFLIHAALDGGVRPVPIRQVLYHYRQHSGSATITSLGSRSPQHGPLRIVILKENVSINEEFLDRPVLPKEVRRLMRHAHAELCYRLTATALYHHQWSTVRDTIRRGWRRNILWPLFFSAMAIQRIGKEITGHE
ncbi:MAG: glycosyltransferase family 2 protein [Anaerolineales bacterium]|jgi:glycosyltransferase involved in cell wall biosynthesis